MKRTITELLARGVGAWLRWLPLSARIKTLMRLIVISTREISPEETLKSLFELENHLYALEGKATIEYGEGIHTKHRHINYHRFFIENIKPGERVLDIGCGNGILSHDIVNNIRDVRVTGVELDGTKIDFAREHYQDPKLSFIQGDALKELPKGTFEVIVLSNVLEHIRERVEFLRMVVHHTKPKRIIIRVPCFERDWRVPLKKELGVDYRLDSTHYIEYTPEEFFQELQDAGLKSTLTVFRWGEIWSVVEVSDEKTDD